MEERRTSPLEMERTEVRQIHRSSPPESGEEEGEHWSRDPVHQRSTRSTADAGEVPRMEEQGSTVAYGERMDVDGARSPGDEGSWAPPCLGEGRGYPGSGRGRRGGGDWGEWESGSVGRGMLGGRGARVKGESGLVVPRALSALCRATRHAWTKPDMGIVRGRHGPV
jgi:hypothetical protein